VHGTEIDESSTTHASNALPVATRDGGEGDEDAASDGSGSAYGMDIDVYDTLLPLPADRKNMTYKQIGWHITNYIIPLHEVESYPLELSGMLGDLGLYIPIVVLLALNKQIDLGSTLVTTGVCGVCGVCGMSDAQSLQASLIYSRRKVYRATLSFFLYVFFNVAQKLTHVPCNT